MLDGKVKKLSIVIVTYNSGALIEGCLNSIFIHNDIDTALEVIVVDNDSADYATTFASIEKKYGESVTLIRNVENGGYGQGNNIGIKAASAPIVLIMNPDVTLFAPVFRKALLQFRDIKLGILGMQQYEKVGMRRQSFLPLHPSIIGLLLYKLYTWCHCYSSRFFCIHGSCFFIRKEAMENIGGFDENIFLYNEEMDIHYRLLQQKKYIIKYDKTLSYIHPMHNRKENLKELKQRFSTYMYVCKKMSLRSRTMICKYINLYRLYLFRSFLKHDTDICNTYSTFILYLLRQKNLQS